MTGEHAPSVAKAREKAAELVGEGPLERMIAGARVRLEIRRNVQLYDRCKRGEIPKMLAGKYVVVGQIKNAQEALELLERITGIRADRPML
jgi:hypothetical protein